MQVLLQAADGGEPAQTSTATLVINVQDADDQNPVRLTCSVVTLCH